MIDGDIITYCSPALLHCVAYWRPAFASCKQTREIKSFTIPRLKKSSTHAYMGLQSHSKPHFPLESVSLCQQVALSSNTVQIWGRYCLLQQEQQCPAPMQPVPAACHAVIEGSGGTRWLQAPSLPSSLGQPKPPSSQAIAVTRHLLCKLLCRPVCEPCLSGQQPLQVISSPCHSNGSSTAALHRFLLNSHLFSNPPVVAAFQWWANWFLCMFCMPGYYNYSSGSFGMKAITEMKAH